MTSNPRKIAVLLALAAAGCSSRDCNDIYIVPGYRIAVVDAETGAAICGVRVEGGGASTIDCTYWLGIGSSEKEMAITVTSDGYLPRTLSVSTHYDTDECHHPIEVPVRIELTRA